MRNIFFIFLSVLQFVCGGERPNILYIFTDDQSSRTVSCYPEAYSWVQTPNIDKLAEEGVRFSNVYIAPFCVASRITAMTGNLPHAAKGTFGGVTLKGKELEEEIKNYPFWPQKLRESGYHTGMIGKWHIYSRMPALNIDWDYSAYWHKKLINEYYNNSKIIINNATPVDLGGYSTDRYTDLAVDYLNGRKDESQPWYLWLCYSGVHMPQTPAERHLGKLDHVKDEAIPVPHDIRPTYKNKPKYANETDSFRKDLKYEKFRKNVRRYHSAVMSIDESVGRLVETLKQNGQFENTVIVFGSDQGLAMGQHGISHKKNAPYDATLNSPLIFRYPKSYQKQAVVDEPVNGTDIIKTFHDIANIEPRKTMDGLSLVPLLKGENHQLERSSMLFSNVRTNFGNSIPKGVKRAEVAKMKEKGMDAMPMYMMVMKGKYKYVRYAVSDYIEELYDMSHLPKDSNNLATNIEYQKFLKEMRNYTIKEFKKTQSGFEGGHFVDLFPEPKIKILP